MGQEKCMDMLNDSEKAKCMNMPVTSTSGIRERHEDDSFLNLPKIEGEAVVKTYKHLSLNNGILTLRNGSTIDLKGTNVSNVSVKIEAGKDNGVNYLFLTIVDKNNKEIKYELDTVMSSLRQIN